MKITLAQLKRLHACEKQVTLFHSLFGQSVEVTEALCLEHVDKFDWDWAVQHLLTATAQAEYNRVMAPASAEYNRVMAAAWAKYNRVMAAAWVDYDRVIAAAWAKYNRVMAAARAEYTRAKAAAFGRLAERS